MDGIISRLSQNKDITAFKVSLYRDPKKADGNGDRHCACITLDQSSSHTVYIVIDNNEAPSEQNADDDLAIADDDLAIIDDDLTIVYEKRVLSAGSRNVGTESIAPGEKGPEEEGLRYFKCNVCWIKKLEREEDYFTVTLCGHVFCSMCKQHILRISSKQCPLCKRSLQHNSFVKIYG